MAAALVIVIFNVNGYYIGGELSGATGQDEQKLAALQFAAKLHELLMIASLSEVVFTWLRKELAFGRGVPFGAFFVGLQFDTLSTFWAPEFWAIVYDAWARGQGVSVGPSTANLMKPRLDGWPAGGTEFWLNATLDRIYPDQIQASAATEWCAAQDTGNPSCPYGDYEIIGRDLLSFWPRLTPMGSMPEELYLTGPFSLRRMEFRHRGQLGDERPIWPNAFTTATVPPAGVSDVLTELGRMWAFAAANAPDSKHFRYRRDAEYLVNFHQPVVMVRCQNITDTDLIASRYLEFIDIGSLVEGTGGNKVIPAEYSRNVFWNGSLAIESLDNILENSTTPEALWLDDTKLLQSTGSTLTAVITMPGSTNDIPYYCCSIDSRLAPSVGSTTRNSPKLVSGSQEEWVTLGTYKEDWNRTYPSAEWAKAMFPPTSTDAGTATNVLGRLASMAGLANSTTPADPMNDVYIVEMILASSIANALGRINFNLSTVGVLRNATDDPWDAPNESWIDGFFPKSQMGSGGSIFDLTATEMENATKSVMQAEVHGYAYSSAGIEQRAMIGILVLYIIVAGAHITFSMLTGWTFTAWNTASEIAVLALNSDRNAAVKNTGAGIGAAATFEQSVRVMSREDQLEMVFGGSQGTNVRAMKTNVEYG
ncbi:hypothetical protein MBLNU459_g2567t2 [Dothideomycetes sp. NU459]